MFHLTDSPSEVVDIVVKSQSSLNQLGENVSDEIRFST
jgi:hypothetical protein